MTIKNINPEVASTNIDSVVSVNKPVEVQTGTLTDTIMKTVRLLNLSKLEWQDRFHEGGTGYIDGIRPNDMPYSAMWGVDNYGRLYVALKTVLRRENSSKVSYPGVETFFQRYTNNQNAWASGNHYGHRVSIVCSRMHERELDLFQRLVKGEEVSIEDPYKPETMIKVKLA